MRWLGLLAILGIAAPAPGCSGGGVTLCDLGEGSYLERCLAGCVATRGEVDGWRCRMMCECCWPEVRGRCETALELQPDPCGMCEGCVAGAGFTSSCAGGTR